MLYFVVVYYCLALTGIVGYLPPICEDDNGCSLYQWDITNKYYNASIHFCQMVTKTAVDEDFAENIGASVIFFDSTQVQSKTLFQSLKNY